MDGLTERLLAMARGASHEQQDYLEVIERVLDQRQVDFDARPLKRWITSWSRGSTAISAWSGWPLLSGCRTRTVSGRP